ncbi:alpha/beta hydrolase [Curtobacterium sp. MCPF17_047]|uniref:alpha/beta fold hydrolase n=1 Tax=unclassified Curtobacterium TaxID=257496 RepID=UPI000DA937DB|nr:MULTISPECIES: alpha/beta hydrolase [unclassified Curtobacterium]PZE63032.1 alpha/beta hydrolase [Curtobacterium sp. MCPF17_001]PZF68963.1 alpha/beta hydrolase [Curtobacterium sp. MCPF17_047]
MTIPLPVDLEVLEAGNPEARTALVLHGGGGPQTVAPIVGHLAPTFHTLAPTHPGWNGTSRPDDIDSIPALASAYLDHLLADGGRDVLLVGSSIGGWIALEMAIQAAADVRYRGLIGAMVDIDGIGAVVDGEPIADFFALDARGLAEVAWHDPERGYMDPASFTDQQRAILQSNAQTMAAVAGRAMSDTTLLGRLGSVNVPTLVVYGESDRVVTPAYGRAVADAIPGASFVAVPAAGHLPHLEDPAATWAAIDPFIARS